MMKYAIVFDVGGSFIKTAVLDGSGKMVPSTYMIYPSKSKASKEEIIDHLLEMIKQQTSRIMDRHFRVEGIGFAFPGPFDYEQGISYIQGVDKFESIYGVNLRQELTQGMQGDIYLRNRQTPDFRIVFENDANLFALGEYASGKAGKYSKSICMTIGTGAGSAFLENGQLIKHREDVPVNGWIYNQPYRESIVDDYISKRGIHRLMSESGLDAAATDIKSLAEVAMNGDAAAIRIFESFGTWIGEMLIPFIQSFQPEAVIIGGQIVKSRHLFLESTKAVLQSHHIELEVTEETSLSAFAGVARLLELERSDGIFKQPNNRQAK